MRAYAQAHAFGSVRCCVHAVTVHGEVVWGEGLALPFPPVVESPGATGCRGRDVMRRRPFWPLALGGGIAPAPRAEFASNPLEERLSLPPSSLLVAVAVRGKAGARGAIRRRYGVGAPPVSEIRELQRRGCGPAI